MQDIQTLQQFLDVSGAQYRVFDLGRRVLKISKEQFNKIENNQTPYPFPLQRKAWFGILFWDPQDSTNHHIWFLQLPLDEQGFLDLPARNDFLRRALEQLGQALINSKSGNKDEDDKTLKDNPWSFSPRQDKMAAFHAKALVELKLPGSQYLKPVIDYLSAPSQYSHWQHIGLQGIADLCARHEEKPISKLLSQHLTALPSEVMVPIFHGLENEAIKPALAKSIISCCSTASANTALVAASIRALSGCTDIGIVKEYLIDVLDRYQDSAISIEILVAISGRAWSVLNDGSLALSFMEALATNDAGQGAFDQVLTDVLFLPTIGKTVRQSFRAPERSETLATAIGCFLSSTH